MTKDQHNELRGNAVKRISRVTTRQNIRILAMLAIEKDINQGKEKKKSEKDIFTKNIVHKEILTTYYWCWPSQYT
jgi:hypothetical protein